MGLRAFKYRIYPNKAQVEVLKKHFGCSRFVYNWGLETKNAEFSKGNKVNSIWLSRELTKLKKDKPWLSEVNAQAIQQALRHLDIAFTKFYAKQADFPKFKKKGKSKDSFTATQKCCVDFSANKISVPKCHNIKAVLHRKFEGRMTSITVSMSKSGKFFASCLVDNGKADPKPKPIDPATTIGVDMGLKSFLTTSDGLKVENPKILKAGLERIKVLDRRMRRKKKGSRRRERARLRLARAYEKITNQRRDFLHKVSNQLADENQVWTICIEDLNIKGMTKNHCLAGSIGDAAWGEFFGMLGYKCGWRGINLVRIGRFEPSSRTCSCCGFLNRNLTLADREWICPKCGTSHDRDKNAARNIRTMGILRGSGPGRPAGLGEMPGRRTGSGNRETVGLG